MRRVRVIHYHRPIIRRYSCLLAFQTTGESMVGSTEEWRNSCTGASLVVVHDTFVRVSCVQDNTLLARQIQWDFNPFFSGHRGGVWAYNPISWEAADIINERSCGHRWSLGLVFCGSRTYLEQQTGSTSVVRRKRPALLKPDRLLLPRETSCAWWHRR